MKHRVFVWARHWTWRLMKLFKLNEYFFLFRRAPQKVYMNQPAAKHSGKFYLSTSAALRFWDVSPSGEAQIRPYVLWVYCLSDLEQMKHWCKVKPVLKYWWQINNSVKACPHNQHSGNKRTRNVGFRQLFYFDINQSTGHIGKLVPEDKLSFKFILKGT